MHRPPALVAGSLVAVAVAVSGCGAAEDQSARATPAPVAGDPVRTETPTPNPTPSPTPTPSETPLPNGLDSTPGPDTGLTPGALASGEGGLEGGRVRFTLVELRRSGDTVVLNATLDRADSGSGSLLVGDAFSDGRSTKGDAPDAFDGVTMVDPVGGRRYLVARDSKGACICSNRLRYARVSRAAPVSLQATLTAPPAGVQTIDLSVPGIKTFTSVAIES